MKALITGGTSGIGRHLAENFADHGYEVTLVSRNEGDLDEMKKNHPDAVFHFLSHDLSDEKECYALLKETESIDFDVFICNAGFGDIGYITETSLKKETKMVRLNDIATLILTKSFLLRFIEKDKGNLLMVASAAAFGVAPYMNVYYATKSFVYSLAHGYYRELKDRNSHVRLSVLCPGPVKTRFEEKANAKFTIHSLEAKAVADYTFRKMMKGHFEIVPGFSIKAAHVFSHLVPKKIISKLLRKQSEIKQK